MDGKSKSFHVNTRLIFSRIILCIHPANERRRYIVTSSHWLGVYTKWSLVSPEQSEPSLSRGSFLPHEGRTLIRWWGRYTGCLLIFQTVQALPKSLLCHAQHRVLLERDISSLSYSQKTQHMSDILVRKNMSHSAAPIKDVGLFDTGTTLSDTVRQIC